MTGPADTLGFGGSLRELLPTLASFSCNQQPARMGDNDSNPSENLDRSDQQSDRTTLVDRLIASSKVKLPKIAEGELAQLLEKKDKMEKDLLDKLGEGSTRCWRRCAK